MTELITRCPKCRTSFRVNEAHLKTARGAVRCGSCLNIFNARDHLITPPEETAPEPEINEPDTNETGINEAGINKTETSEPEAHDDEDILISDDMKLDEPDQDEPGALIDDELDSNIFIAKSASKAEINLFERRIKTAQENDKDHSEADESWALNLLEDENDSKKEESKAFTFSLDEEPPETTEEADADTKEEEKAFSSVFQILEEENGSVIEQASDAFPENPLGDEIRSYDTETVEAVFDDAEEQNNQNVFFESFEPDPLEMPVKHTVEFWKSRPFLILMSVLALLALVIQIAYFNFDRWGRQDAFRPYYASVCKVLGCALPVRQDLNNIKIDNMIVVVHPQKKGMLLVDATLQNRADFSQYFPSLLLSFTNIDNQLVSEYRFTPADYVGGELAGKDLMPARHPIHITLEIVDPGAEAVNYQIAIVKP